jgi:AcrR family transcriptional regulator
MTDTSVVLRKRGRPSRQAADDLSDLIVETALANFRSHGFEATSIDAIAHDCKASKHTIYRRFSSKNVLFIAAVGRDRQAILDRFATVDIAEKDTLSALRATCSALFEIAVSPGSTDLYRMCIGAVPKFPLIGAQFAESESRIQDILEPLVKRAQAEGILASGEPRRLSGQLYYATIGEIWGHALMGLAYVGDLAMRSALFEANWQMFLNGYRCR